MKRILILLALTSALAGCVYAAGPGPGYYGPGYYYHYDDD